MNKIYDLVIIGAGPAGLSTAIYSGRAKQNTLVIDKEHIGGQIKNTAEIVNYPGIIKSSGAELVEDMKKQALNFGVAFTEANVTSVDLLEPIKIIHTNKGIFKAISVVIATGASPRTLGFPGEKEFTGRGVAYCSTCDGEFFKDLDVFVIGAGFAAAEEAIFLTRFAKKVIVIAREPEFTCAKTIADKVLSNEKIEVRFNTEIVEASGNGLLQHAKFINNITKEVYEYNASKEDNTFGIFIFVGYKPETELFKNIIELDSYGYILTNENMETNIPGIYAVGDIRPKVLRQVVTAVADGAIAATCSEKYISDMREQLGIKETYEKPLSKESTSSKIENKDTNWSKISNLLNDNLRAQLKTIFDKMEKEVTLVSIIDKKIPKSIELRDLILDISSLSKKLKTIICKKGENSDLEWKINADKFPVVALLDSKQNFSGVKFHGVPGGHELNSFVLAIYNLAGPGQAIDKYLLNDIKSITEPINIKIAVSLACHFCPDVVTSCQRLAIENKNIQAEMIDLSEFPEIKKDFKVMSVPAIIINNKDVYFGAKKLNEIIKIIKNI